MDELQVLISGQPDPSISIMSMPPTGGIPNT
jgi:hypothetical protein